MCQIQNREVSGLTKHIRDTKSSKRCKERKREKHRERERERPKRGPRERGRWPGPPPNHHKKQGWTQWTAGRQSRAREGEMILTHPSRRGRWSPGRKFGPSWPDTSAVSELPLAVAEPVWAPLSVKCSLTNKRVTARLPPTSCCYFPSWSGRRSLA